VVYAHHFLIFTAVDPYAEKYYSIGPYAMCGDNTIRNIDPDGRDGWDVLQGVSEAFFDDANINPNAKPLSNSSNPNNKTHYTIGQVIGHLGAAITGAFETIHGGGTVGGGVVVAVAGSETVVAVPYGTAIAVVGAAEAGHGMMLMAKAAKGAKNLVEETKKLQEKKQVSSERQAKRQAQTENGKNNPLSFRICPSLNTKMELLVAGICNPSFLYYKVPIAIGM